MTYKDNAVKDLRIAYIGGGSRGWAWTFMRDLALELALGGTIVLYDIDKEAAKANEIIGNGISEREEAVGKWKYIVADTLKEALTGSDFAVISILPGTFDDSIACSSLSSNKDMISLSCIYGLSSSFFYSYYIS